MHACMHTLYGRAQMHNWILDYNMARLTLCKTIWICVVGEFQVVHKTPQLQMAGFEEYRLPNYPLLPWNPRNRLAFCAVSPPPAPKAGRLVSGSRREVMTSTS